MGVGNPSLALGEAAFGVISLVIGIAMLVGALAGSRDPLRPLAGVLGEAQPGLGATPWTRRCLGRCVLFKRWACEQVQPGNGDAHPLAKALLLLTGEQGIDVPSIAGALQVRRFVASAGEPRHIALIELGSASPRLPAAQPGALMRVYRDYAA